MKFAVGLGPFRTMEGFTMFVLAVLLLVFFFFAVGVVVFASEVGYLSKFDAYFWGFLAGNVILTLVIAIRATLREWEDKKEVRS